MVLGSLKRKLWILIDRSSDAESKHRESGVIASAVIAPLDVGITINKAGKLLWWVAWI